MIIAHRWRDNLTCKKMYQHISLTCSPSVYGADKQMDDTECLTWIMWEYFDFFLSYFYWSFYFFSCLACTSRHSFVSTQMIHSICFLTIQKLKLISCYRYIAEQRWSKREWSYLIVYLFSVSFNAFTVNYVYWCWCLTSHATIIQSYMWRYRCAGGLKKKLYLRLGSQRHRHFAVFFNMPVLHRHGANLFIRWFRHTAPFSRLLRHAGDTEDVFST